MLIIVLYFFSFVVVALVSRIFKNAGTRKLFEIVLCFCLLFGFFGFRDITVLNDTPHYYGYYYGKALYTSYLNESIFTFHFMDKFEYGFQVLVHFLIKYVSKDPYTIILFSSLIITIGNLWFIQKKAKSVAMVCFFMLISYVFFMHYCIIRQSFAIIIFYIAYCNYLEKGHNVKYCMLILLASSFHSSALVLLLLPVFKLIKPTKSHTLLILGGAVIMALFIFKLLAAFGLHNNPYYKLAIQKDSFSIIGVIEAFMLFLIVSVSYFLYKKEQVTSFDRNIYSVYLLALCVSIILPVFYAFARINDYLYPIIIITFLRYTYPQLIGKRAQPVRRNRFIKQTAGIIVSLAFISKLLIVNAYRPEWLHIIPYKTYDFSSHYHYYHLYPQK